MARIEDLIDEVRDPSLRSQIAEGVKGLKSTKRFGLVFEQHLPSWLLLAASLAWALAALGNVLGDVFDMSIGETLWTAGMTAFGLTLVAGVVALTVNSPWRWSGLFLIGYAAGWGFPDSGGLWLSGVSLIAMAFWIDRTAAKTDRSHTLNGSAASA